MAISGNLIINVGLPNESTNSDSLYTAFRKINTNFNTLFANASKVEAGNGITVTNNPSNTIISANLIAGNNIVLSNINGAIKIEAVGGGGNGGGNITGVLAGNGLTGGGYSGNVVLALANSGVVPGTYSNPIVNIDRFGRIINATQGAPAGTVTSVAINPGAGIQVQGGPITSAGAITVTNTGVTRLTAGTGITLTGNTGNIQISAAGGGGNGVTSVGISSNQLVISGSPIVGAGTININLPNNLAIVGNITAGNTINANYFVGNGYFLSGLNPSNVIANTANFAAFAGNVTESAQPNITSVGNLISLNVVGNIKANNLGNIVSTNYDGNSANVLHGDGTWSADQTNYGNTNVAAYLQVYTGNITAGNVYANTGTVAALTLKGEGGNISNIQGANVSGTVANASFGLTAGTVVANAQPNITSVGNLTSLTIFGNVSAGNANLGNAVTANFFVGNGYYLTGLNLSNVVANTANFAAYAGNVTEAAQSNITSLGTLANLNVSGNIVASNITANTGVFTGNGAGLTNLAGGNVSGQVANALIAGTVYTAAQPNITSVGNLTALTVIGNITGANINGTHYGAATGLTNIPGANVTGNVANATTAGTVTTAAQPNITSLGTLSSLGVTGNVTAGNLVGPHANGNSNINIPVANGNINLSAAGNSNIIVVSGSGAYINGFGDFTGKVSATSFLGPLANGTSNVNIPASGGNVNISVGGTTNVFVVTSTSANISGNLSVSANLLANNITSNNIIKTVAVLFASLPVAATAGAGARAFITDGNLAAATNFGSLVAGGAANNVPVYSDGTNWRIG